MNRSGYSDCCEGWDLVRWRGAVASAIRGRRGQEFLRELGAAMDAMPVKRLVAHELRSPDGEVCALGAVGAARGMDMDDIDVEDRELVASVFGIAEAMAAEIEFLNDEAFYGPETPEARWRRMRDWCAAQTPPVEYREET